MSSSTPSPPKTRPPACRPRNEGSSSGQPASSVTADAGLRMTSTIAEAVRDGALRLAALVDSPRLEVRLLLAHALGVTRADLIRDPDRSVDTAALHDLIARRISHEPLAHILGRREFWSLDFQVSPATLIP